MWWSGRQKSNSIQRIIGVDHSPVNNLEASEATFMDSENVSQLLQAKPEGDARAERIGQATRLHPSPEIS